MAVGTGVKPHPPISETRGRARGQGSPKRHPRARGQLENEPAASRVATGARPRGVRFLTSDLYAHFTEFVADARESVHIIAPFIRVEALNVILRGVNLRDVTLVTTWSTKDILTGASDLDVYPYLRSRGWRLYLHPGLHAKLLISDSGAAIVTSANITRPGLGLGERSNVECALETPHLPLEERLWLLNLVRASLLVDDEYFLAFRRHVDRQPERGREPEFEEFDPAPYLKRQHFLLSSLPLSDTPEKLLSRP
jgi:phosphatidylserine/phosphatidylglycerophosphate/cardiolipin synthase-like enzyme